MNKKFAYISLFLMIFLGISSCSDEDIFTPRDSQATFTLSLPGQDVMTRAKDPGLDFFNENTVTTVDLFFYHTGETDQNAVLRKHLEGSEIATNTTSSNEETEMFVYDLTSSISINDLRTIFPNYDDNSAEHKCEVYAIVNLPANATIDATDMASLKQIELTSDAFSQLVDAANASFKKGAIPSNFVMSGQASTITLDPDNKRKLVGNIDVYRSASKVTLELTKVEPTFTDANGHVWQSQTDNISVGLKHGQKTGYVDAPQLHTISGDFKTANIHMVPGTWITGGTTAGHYRTDVPMYTYPNVWTNDLSHRTSLLVCVYWRDNSVPNSSFQPTYYEIPISDEDEQILRNYHYRIQLSIGIIGSLVEEEPVKLDHCSYVILPWGSNKSILADLNQVRYLVVDETEVHMDNIISRNINFSSSHNLKTEANVGSTENVLHKKIYYRNLSSTTATWTELPSNSFRVVINNPAEGGGTSYFTIEHDLVNNMDELSDYTMFKMEFDVYHEDQDPATTEYIQRIVAYQTPMIYAEDEMNTNYIQYMDGTTSDYNDHRGYMWVNNGFDVSTKYGGQDGISSTAGNTNPNRYIIKATALTSDRYIIGDPRTTYINNELTTNNIGTTRSDIFDWSVVVPSSTGNHYGVVAQTFGYTYNYYYYYNNVYHWVENLGNETGLTYNGNSLSAYDLYDWEYTSEASAVKVGDWYYWTERTGRRPNYTYTCYRAQYYALTYGTGRTLQYYHPTDENNARTENMVSPEFMVASSYGVTSSITKENARKRCASYQEDGYPAGRWRIPTTAEVRYVVELSAWGIIPVLFGSLPGTEANATSSSDYWSANGIVNVTYTRNSDGTVTGTVTSGSGESSYVRCVYDKWYWTDKCDINTYTWGDKETF